MSSYQQDVTEHRAGKKEAPTQPTREMGRRDNGHTGRGQGNIPMVSLEGLGMGGQQHLKGPEESESLNCPQAWAILWPQGKTLVRPSLVNGHSPLLRTLA